MNYIKYFDPSWAGGGWTLRSLIIGNFEIQSRSGGSDLWGRFGGGWNWKVGIQVGGSSVIITLLTFSIRFGRITDERKAKLLEKSKEHSSQSNHTGTAA